MVIFIPHFQINVTFEFLIFYSRHHIFLYVGYIIYFHIPALMSRMVSKLIIYENWMQMGSQIDMLVLLCTLSRLEIFLYFIELNEIQSNKSFTLLCSLWQNLHPTVQYFLYPEQSRNGVLMPEWRSLVLT